MVARVRWGALAVAVIIGGCEPEAKVAEGPPEFVATRSITFGDAQGDGALSNVWGVAVSDDGHVFLSEPRFARVVEFKPDGTFSRIVGVGGDGPGEFRSPGYLSWRGDSLAVTDFQRGINLFLPDRTFAKLISFNVNDGSSAFGVRPIFPLADGTVAALAPARSSEITRGTAAYETWLKTTRDGSVIDTLAVLAVEGRLYSVQYKGIGRSGTHPLGWAPLMAASPTGKSLVVVDRPPAKDGTIATYQVLRLDLQGDTVAAASIAYTPVPLGPGQVDSIAAAMARDWAQGLNATTAAVAAEIKSQIDWPRHQPPVTAALVGADGSVWLRREGVGVSLVPWDVLDSTLSRIGQVKLPVGLELKVVARDHAYGLELGEFDIPRLVRLNVSLQ